MKLPVEEARAKTAGRFNSPEWRQVQRDVNQLKKSLERYIDMAEEIGDQYQAGWGKSVLEKLP